MLLSRGPKAGGLGHVGSYFLQVHFDAFLFFFFSPLDVGQMLVWGFEVFSGQHFGQRKRFGFAGVDFKIELSNVLARRDDTGIEHFIKDAVVQNTVGINIDYNVLGVTLHCPHHVAFGKKIKNFLEILLRLLDGTYH